LKKFEKVFTNRRGYAIIKGISKLNKKTRKRSSRYPINSRDLLGGAKQDLEDSELALELLAEISRSRRMPTVIMARYR
jgi:hypothetical protein